ncbi:MAG: hypothetical protein J2P15_16870 [Micromonosporaceae bacterium]|nr:hypothetical protein [Micromonosporaceae bacterium]
MVDRDDDASGWINPAGLAGWRDTAPLQPAPASEWTVPAAAAPPNVSSISVQAWFAAAAIGLNTVPRLVNGGLTLANPHDRGLAASLRPLLQAQLVALLLAIVAYRVWLHAARGNAKAWDDHLGRASAATNVLNRFRPLLSVWLFALLGSDLSIRSARNAGNPAPLYALAMVLVVAGASLALWTIVVVTRRQRGTLLERFGSVS